MSSEIIYGINPVREVLLHSGGRVEWIAVTRGGMGPELREVRRLAGDRGIKVELKTRKELNRLAGGEGHQGVVLSARRRDPLSLPQLLARLKDREAPLLIVLDGVTDPRNLGAVIRSAEVFGGSGVIIGRDRAAGLSGAAMKASAGAMELIPVVTVVNIPRALKSLKNAGFWVVGTAGDAGKKCCHHRWEGPTALVLGSEGKGMRRLVREGCD
jgi:23S rRNA (guanosine2251-2'-O)-methyltransferase